MSNTFIIDGVGFEFIRDKYERTSTKENLILLKPRNVLDLYTSLIPQDRPSVILEIGIFEAGSAIAFAMMNKLAKVIAIDIQNRPHLNDLVRSLGLQDRVKLYPNISQDDELSIRDIINNEALGNPLDLVVDDGSHMYDFSRASFEILFPYVKTGGFYVVEDWNWAHYGGIYQTEKWLDKPALTNLVFELVMLAGSASPDIDYIEIRGISALLKKRSGYAPGNRLSITDGIRNRGKTLALI